MANISDVINNYGRNFRSIKMTKTEELFNELTDVYAKLNEKSGFEDKVKKKRYYTFSQIAGLNALDTVWFKEIIDEKALKFLSKFRHKISFCFDNDTTVLLVSGIRPNDVKEIVGFFEKNIEQYAKYQYFTREIDYEFEDGVIYDITDVDSTQDIVNIIIYFS